MKRNFEINTSITSISIIKLNNAIFNTYGIRYGYLPIKMEDTIIKQVEFTLCGKTSLNKNITNKIEAFVMGWFAGYDLPVYSFVWK